MPPQLAEKKQSNLLALGFELGKRLEDGSSIEENKYKRKRSSDGDASLSGSEKNKKICLNLGLDEAEGVELGAPAEAVSSALSVGVKSLAVLALDFRDVSQYYDKLVMSNGSSRSFRKTNSSLPPFVRKLEDVNLQFPQVELLEHCSALVTRTEKNGIVTESLKLTEGGKDNKDSPRVILTKGGRTKTYVYHIVALVEAVRNSGPRLSLDLLRGVSQEKSEQNAQTILHLCGHHWCLSPGHLAVGSKKLNDEQTSCHRFLQSAKSLVEYQNFQQYSCKHVPKCWTIVYGGEFRDVISWADQ
jgi:hypothetical protein